MIRRSILLAPFVCFASAGAMASSAPRPSASETIARWSGAWSPRFSSTSPTSKLVKSEHFSKISWFFPERVRVSKVVLESCAGPFNDGVDVYADFARRHLFIEGGQKKLTADLGFISPDGESVRSLTVNFRHNSPLCLKDIRVLGVDGVTLAAKPEFSTSVETEALSRETGDGDWRAEQPLNLFDSRFETRWRFRAGPKNDDSSEAVGFRFSSPITIRKLRLWNGNQASALGFSESGRVKRLSLKMDEGLEEVVDLKDAGGPQDLQLKKDLRGSSLQLRALSVQPGSKESEGSLSEIRFAGPDDWMTPTVDLKAVREANVAAFEKLSLNQVLDQELSSGRDKESWHFRFRSDGSFYVRGYADDWGHAGSFFAVGTYRVVSSAARSAGPKAKSPRIQVELEGFRRVSPNAPDADPCELACGEPEGFSSLTVRDAIVIDGMGKGIYMVRNRTPKAARALPFKDLKTHISSLKE